jgi:putative DNA primase/helicase
LQPHIVIESSPGKWHAYWLVSDSPLEQFKPLQQALAQRFNGDKAVCDLPRVMRLPGFLHQKGEPVLTRIHRMADDLTPYTLAQLASITTPPVQPERPKPKATQQPIRTTATATGFEAVKRAAQGQWSAILGRLGIQLPQHKHHAPCPACGGKDRFRFDDKDGHGTFICSQGGNGTLAGDGFSLIQHHTQCSAEEALKRVRDIVMPSTDKMTDNKKAAPPSEEDAAPETQTSGDSVAGGGNGGESEDAAIERLASLSAIDYERVRTDEAKKLNIRATVLDKLVGAKRRESQSQDENTAGSNAIFESVNAWPYPVQGDTLLAEITVIVQRFTVLSVEQARACAFWIAFTWFIEGAKVAPMINITSPEKRCGKSTLLLVIESMVNKPLLASNISASALFRSIELWTPTLLIDETDAFLNEKEELRGILNAGHYRKTAFVIRTVGDNHEPRKFMTWCAKVLCGIGKVAHTLTDRSIVIELRRKLVHEQVENVHLADESEFAVIRQKLKRWSEDCFEQYRAIRPPRIDGINDRAADNWQPLQAIAELAGKDWPDKCRHAAIKLAGIEEEAPSVNVELLMDIAEVFHGRGATKIFTADLLDTLCEDEEKPWATWNRGKPISAHQVSKRLEEFKIQPHQIRIGAMSKKGYELPQINEAIIRYKPTPVTPPYQTETPIQPNDTNAFSDSDKRNSHKMFRDEKPLKPLRPNGCIGVSDSDTQKQGHKESEGVNGAGWSIDL